MSRIFISYKRSDKGRVFKIKDEIERAVNESCWIDLDGIESDRQFVDVIIKAINRCDVFLFMYSRRHLEIMDFDKDWTIKEITFAKDKGKKIVFVNLDSSPLSDWFRFMFGSQQQVNYKDPDARNHLFADLRMWLGKNEDVDSLHVANNSDDAGDPDAIRKNKRFLIWCVSLLVLISIVGGMSWHFSSKSKYQDHVRIPEGITAYPVEANGVIFNLVKVAGGEFMMGRAKNDGGNDDEIPHAVILSDYCIGQTEVTRELWNSVMSIEGNPDEDNYPVMDVSWDDCQEFINLLNQITGYKFSFPTEAQWEFAARGGLKSQGYRYSGGNDLDEISWYELNSSGGPHRVAAKAPNELGIYDMNGNVWEWCHDYYGEYDTSVLLDPSGPKNGYRRVRRGGSWQDSDGCSSVSFRSRLHPENSSRMGLRLALNL